MIELLRIPIETIKQAVMDYYRLPEQVFDGVPGRASKSSVTFARASFVWLADQAGYSTYEVRRVMPGRNANMIRYYLKQYNDLQDTGYLANRETPAIVRNLLSRHYANVDKYLKHRYESVS